MELLADDLNDADATQLWQLQRHAYAVEARIIADDRIPQLRETLSELRDARLSWWVVRGQGTNKIVGALAFRQDTDTLDIERLVVDPERHRSGIATALVQCALRASGRVTVSTGAQNAPARKLYAGLGFVHQGDREVLSGLWISDYCNTGKSLA